MRHVTNRRNISKSASNMTKVHRWSPDEAGSHTSSSQVTGSSGGVCAKGVLGGRYGSEGEGEGMKLDPPSTHQPCGRLTGEISLWWRLILWGWTDGASSLWGWTAAPHSPSLVMKYSFTLHWKAYNKLSIYSFRGESGNKNIKTTLNFCDQFPQSSTAGQTPQPL